MFLPWVKLTSERPRLISWWGGFGGGLGASLPCPGVRFLVLLCPLWSLFSSPLLCPPSLLSYPGETLVRPGWQSPCWFGPRRARHGSSRSECRCRPRANGPDEKSTRKHSALLHYVCKGDAESGPMHSVQLVLAMQGL